MLVGTVEVAAETVGARNDTVLADSALSQWPSNGAAVVTNAEGVGADADQSTVLRTGCAGGAAVAASGIGGARIAGRGRSCR